MVGFSSLYNAIGFIDLTLKQYNLANYYSIAVEIIPQIKLFLLRFLAKEFT